MTNLENELQKLQSLKPPTPSPETRARAIDAAMQIENEALKNNSQGNSVFHRLMNRTKGNNTMKKPNKKKLYPIIGGAAVSLLAIVLITNTGDHQYLANDTATLSMADTQMAPLSKQSTAAQAPIAMSRQMESNALVAPQTTFYNPELDRIPYIESQSGNRFQKNQENAVKSTAETPVSTFSIDVDTSSYSFIRRMINQGQLPPSEAVRVEEMINYFDYDYAVPDSLDKPFKPTVALYPTPWNKDTKLLHIGIKGHQLASDKKPASNLVFLIDISGSMQAQDKLPLLKNAFKLLLKQLDDNDTIAIATYAGNAGTVLEPTKVSEQQKILAALDGLQSGGGTAGAAGIEEAYRLAKQSYKKEGNNRVILATDGDFNVGINDPDQLKQFIEAQRDSGIFLSVLGFGQGNYNDHIMQTLAQNGNGNAAYIDTLQEAQKVFVEDINSTLYPIAKDVKIQLEFNPAKVAEYRLIGYETRLLKEEDFKNDKIDAGEVGAGHAVTAIYEIVPTESKTRLLGERRYEENKRNSETAIKSDSKEYAFLKIRYKKPDGDKSQLISQPITEMTKDIDSVSDDIRFAAAVAAFGQILKGADHTNNYSHDDIINLATSARGKDPYGYRNEFIKLVRLAKNL